MNTRGRDYEDREPFHQITGVSTQNAVEDWNQSHPYGSVVYAWFYFFNSFNGYLLSSLEILFLGNFRYHLFIFTHEAVILTFFIFKTESKCSSLNQSEPCSIKDVFCSLPNSFNFQKKFLRFCAKVEI